MKQRSTYPDTELIPSCVKVNEKIGLVRRKLNFIPFLLQNKEDALRSAGSVTRRRR